jgi:cell division protein FtsX
MEDGAALAHLVEFIFKCLLRVMQIMAHPLAFLVICAAVIATGFAIRLAAVGIRRLRIAKRSREETT